MGWPKGKPRNPLKAKTSNDWPHQEVTAGYTVTSEAIKDKLYGELDRIVRLERRLLMEVLNNPNRRVLITMTSADPETWEVKVDAAV